MAEATNGKSDSIPLSVLDRFLTLSKEQHDAYGSMVAALDSMSAKMLDLTDQITNVTTTINKEQLAAEVKIMQDNLKSLRDNVVSCFGSPQYNVVSVLAKSLEYEKYEDKDVQDLANAGIWLLAVISFFQKRKLIFVFVMGIAIVTLFGTASEGVKSVIKLIIGLL